MDDTRQRLLNAAGQTFAEKGFEATTIREICRLADANIAAVNYHFGEKEQLYIEAVKQAHCHRGEMPQFDWTDETPPERKLEDFLRDMMSMMVDDESPSWHIELMMREMARPTAACTELVRSFIGPMFDLLNQIIAEILPVGTPAGVRHLHAFSIVGQCLLYRYHRPVGRLLIDEGEFRSLWNVDKLTRHITDFSLAALRSAARTSDAEAAP
ncbi:MAG: CerR family C-terminal domain-containing protein [Planctomycetaceae bacterium]|nr:CerR family C-terminal domain-containing protein [Planctomycetaceae bacterium]